MKLPSPRRGAQRHEPEPAQLRLVFGAKARGAVVVAKQPASAALAEQLAAYVHTKTGDPRKVPSRVAFVEQLPLNHLGKIRRPEVIELATRQGLPTHLR